MAMAAACVVAKVDQAPPWCVPREREDRRRVDLLAEACQPLRLGDKFFEQAGDVATGGLTAEANCQAPIGWRELCAMQLCDQR